MMQVSTWLSGFAFTTVLDANFGSNQLKIMPEIIPKLLHTFSSGCALQWESEQMPISWISC